MDGSNGGVDRRVHLPIGVGQFHRDGTGNIYMYHAKKMFFFINSNTSLPTDDPTITSSLPINIYYGHKYKYCSNICMGVI